MMTGEQSFTFRGLKLYRWTNYSWFEDFDLQVFALNVIRETHSMLTYEWY